MHCWCRASIPRTSSVGHGETLAGGMFTLTSCLQGLAALMTACSARCREHFVDM